MTDELSKRRFLKLLNHEMEPWCEFNQFSNKELSELLYIIAGEEDMFERRTIFIYEAAKRLSYDL